MKAFFGILGTIIGIGIIVSLIGWSAGWWNKAAEVAGPANVSDQYHRVITDWESLYTAAGNACYAQNDDSDDTGAPTLVESPVLAYAATYAKIRTDYNSRMNNIFEAGAVAPIGYPREIDQSIGANPSDDWCQVQEKLDKLKDASK